MIDRTNSLDSRSEVTAVQVSKHPLATDVRAFDGGISRVDRLSPFEKEERGTGTVIRLYWRDHDSARVWHLERYIVRQTVLSSVFARYQVNNSPPIEALRPAYARPD